MSELSVEKAKKHLEGLKRDYQDRIKPLQLKIAEERLYDRDTSSLEKQEAMLDDLYEKAFAQAEAAIHEALKVEGEQAAAAAGRQAVKDAEVKAQFLRQWEKNGGKAEEFEAAWPALRSAYLEERTLQGVMSEKESAPGIKL